MKAPKNIALTEFKYFIVQDDNQNAVGIISESDDSVSFCNLTLIPYLHDLTGKIEFKLGAYPETPIRVCANPTFRDNIQIGLMRSMIDITKNPREVERVLKYNKGAEIIASGKLMQGQV